MFITDLLAISPQETHIGYHLDVAVKVFSGNKYMAVEPSYAGLIKPSMLRRMGKSIRIGIGAGVPLLQRNENIEGVIIGSSDGGLEDCIKFLNQIVDYDEGMLTPTNFVQSTPNALAGHLALMDKTTGYNITHVHKGLAFENCLLDALLLFETQSAKRLLVGNVEEISDYNFNIETLAKQFKTEDVSSDCLLPAKSEGTVCGEGSAMFVLDAQADEYLAQIVDVHQISNPDLAGVVSMLTVLLNRNEMIPDDIDAVIVGYNGDSRTDHWYSAVVERLFPKQTIITYKNIVGEYPTSSAFAVYLAVNILNGANIPSSAISRKGSTSSPQKILIYNHFKGIQHGAILLSI